MADDVQRLAVLIEANTRSYENAMKKMQTQTERAIRASTKSIATLDARLKGLSSTVGRVAGVFGLAFGGRALITGITNVVKAGEAIGDTAQKLGLTAEAYQELSFAATQSGTSQDALATAIKFMGKTLGEAERGSKAAQAEFARLGISFSDIRGKAPDQVFTLLLDLISKIEDPLRRNAELMKIFGRSGLEMAGMAAEGAAGIERLREKARALGLVISNETIRKMQEAGDKLDIIRQAALPAAAALAEGFIPAINALSAAVANPAFQAALKNTAEKIGAIVKFLTDNPEVLGFLAGAAVGGRIGGPLGAAVGGVIGATSAQGGVQPVERKTDPGMRFFRSTATTANIMASDSFRAAQAAAKGASDAAVATNGWAVAVDKVKVETLELSEAQKRLIETVDTVKDVSKSFVSDFVGGLREGKTSIEALTDALSGLADRLASLAIDKSFDMIFGAISSGLLGGTSFAGGVPMPRLRPRAMGGPVSAGQPYLVGEKRPEIFIPQTSGRIANIGGGGMRVSVNVVNRSGVAVDAEARQSPSGDLQLDVMLDKMTGQNLLRRGSTTNRAARIAGIEPPLIRR